MRANATAKVNLTK
jgi:hypothetical protein